MEAELQAAIEAVKIAIRDGFSCLKIHTDSRQLFDGATCRMNKWMGNNWQTPNGEALTSKEKWIELQDKENLKEGETVSGSERIGNFYESGEPVFSP